MAQRETFDAPQKKPDSTQEALSAADVELGRQMTALMPNLRAFAVVLGSDSIRAEDLAQETFLKAWLHRDSFTRGTDLRAWLLTILRNAYITERRRERREILQPSELYDHAVANIVSYLSDAEVRADLLDVRKALNTMSPIRREALMLVAGSGFSYDEAAEILGAPAGTVRTRVYRAREELRLLLGIGPDDHRSETRDERLRTGAKHAEHDISEHEVKRFNK